MHNPRHNNFRKHSPAAVSRLRDRRVDFGDESYMRISRSPRRRRSLSPLRRGVGGGQRVWEGERRSNSLERRDWDLVGRRSDRMRSRSPPLIEQVRNRPDYGMRPRSPPIEHVRDMPSYGVDVHRKDQPLAGMHRRHDVYEYMDRGGDVNAGLRSDSRVLREDVDGMLGRKSMNLEEGNGRGLYGMPPDVRRRTENTESAGNISLTSMDMGLGRFKDERVKSFDPLLSEKVLYDRGEKPKFYSRDAPSVMLPPSRSVDLTEASQFKDFGSTSTRNSRVNILKSQHNGPPLPADEYIGGTAKLTERIRYGDYGERRVLDSGMKPEAERRDLAMNKREPISPSRAGNHSYLYNRVVLGDSDILDVGRDPKLEANTCSPSRTNPRNYIYPRPGIREPNDHPSIEMYGSSERIDPASGPNKMNLVKEHHDTSESSHLKISNSSLFDYPSLVKQSTPNDIGMSRSSNASRAGQFVDTLTTQGRKVSREQEIPYFLDSIDHGTTLPVKSNYNLARDEVPIYHRERMRSPEFHREAHIHRLSEKRMRAMDFHREPDMHRLAEERIRPMEFHREADMHRRSEERMRPLEFHREADMHRRSEERMRPLEFHREADMHSHSEERIRLLDFNRETDGRRHYEERMRSPEFDHEAEMNRHFVRTQGFSGKEYGAYKPSHRVPKRKHQILDEEMDWSDSRDIIPRVWNGSSRTQELDDRSEEWIHQHPRSSYSSKRVAYDRGDDRRFQRLSDRTDIRKLSAYEDRSSSYEPNELVLERPIKGHKSSDKYSKVYLKPGSSSHYKPNQCDRKNVFPKPQNVWIRGKDGSKVDAHNDVGQLKNQEAFTKSEPNEDTEEFKQLVQNHYLSFTRKLNDNATVRRRYKEQGRAGSLFCIVCGRSESKEFSDTRRLATHAYMSHKDGLRTQHLGLHKAICVLLGWKNVVPPNVVTWFPVTISNSEALAQKEDLIIWPPVVVIRDSTTSDHVLAQQRGITVEALEEFIKGKGVTGGKVKIANNNVIIVKFLGTSSGVQDAEKLHLYFAENNRGRVGFEKLTSSKRETSKIVAGKGSEGKLDELELYGYMGIAEDLDHVDFDTKKKCSIRSKKEIQDIVDAPVKT